MSLKFVHLVFIIASLLLAGWVAGWCYIQYASTHETAMLVGGIASALAAGGLVLYGLSFIKKFRNVKYY